MVDQSNSSPSDPDYSQLSQVQVPLEKASEVFSQRDASGRIPIVVIPIRLNRIRNEVVGLGLLVGIGGVGLGLLLRNPVWIPLSITVALLLIVIGFYRSFFVRVPEGASGMLARAGKYRKTIGSGSHIVPPWIIVTHLVSQREIPFDAPLVQALTKDNVRANVDTLFTFSINDPYHFVYSISAFDFDQVFQAACQDALRTMIRQINAVQVADLKKQDMAELVEVLNQELEGYGVSISKISITFAQPPADFMHSQEARQLAVFIQDEQREQQNLAELRLKFEQALAQQRVIAEAENEALRMERLQDRLETNPLAAKYQIEMARLEVARALAGNTRALLQIGDPNDMVGLFMMRDAAQNVEPFIPKTPPADADQQIS